MGLSVGAGSFLAACGKAIAPVPANQVGAAPVSGKPVEISLVSAGGFYMTPLYYALDNKLFEKHGVKIAKYVPGASGGTTVIQGFSSGSIDIAVTGIGPQGVFWGKGMPVRLVSYIGHSEDFHIMSFGKGFNSPEDLKGKRIGISGVGSQSEVLARIILERMGIDLHKDLQPKPMQINQMVQLGKLGQIDAAVMSSPYIEVMEKEIPNTKRLVNLVDAWKKEFGTDRGAPSHGVVVHTALLKDKLDGVKGFVAALDEAIGVVAKDNNLMKSLLVKYEQLEDKVIDEAFGKMQLYWTGGPLQKTDIDNAMRVWNEMYKYKYMDSAPSTEFFFDLNAAK